MKPGWDSERGMKVGRIVGGGGNRGAREMKSGWTKQARQRTDTGLD